MSIIFNSSAPVKSCNSSRFGHGLGTTRHATVEESARHWAETTYSLEEKRVADHFAITLAEARELIADGEDAIRDAELCRMRAWDEINEASDDDADYRVSYTAHYAKQAVDPNAMSLEAYLAAVGETQATTTTTTVEPEPATPPKARRKRTNSALARRRAAAGLAVVS